MRKHAKFPKTRGLQSSAPRKQAFAGELARYAHLRFCFPACEITLHARDARKTTSTVYLRCLWTPVATHRHTIALLCHMSHGDRNSAAVGRPPIASIVTSACMPYNSCDPSFILRVRELLLRSLFILGRRNRN